MRPFAHLQAAVPTDDASTKNVVPALETGYTVENPAYSALTDRELFHYLMNFDAYPDVAPAVARHIQGHLTQTRQTLLSSQDPRTQQLLRGGFSRDKLVAYLKQNYDTTCLEFEKYDKAWQERLSLQQQKRKNSSHQESSERRPALMVNEMLPTREFAEYFVRQSAPTKLVDGSWLQNVCKSSTNPNLRRILTPLFTIYAEELGEGNTCMNHVNLYRKMLESTGIFLPDTASREFISSESDLLDTAFTAPCIQLGLAVFPEQLLPEIIGFNMGYEELPLHILITTHELRHLGIDPYYFQLHVVIDNASSGHAKVAQDVAINYLKWIKDHQGIQCMEEMYLRILTGYFLNDVNPMKASIDAARVLHLQHQQAAHETLTTVPSSALDAMMRMLEEKLPYATRIHPSKILGSQPLNVWLTELYDSRQSGEWIKKAMLFLTELADSHWIVPGSPETSPFVTDLCAWGGRMFCVFTKQELAVIEAWIKDLGSSRSDMERVDADQSTLEPTHSEVDESTSDSSVNSPMDSESTSQLSYGTNLTTPISSPKLPPTQPGVAVGSAASASSPAGELPDVQAARDMVQLIIKKKRRGSRAHGNLTLPSPKGERKINDWFDDPEGFMQALVYTPSMLERLAKSVEPGGSMQSYFNAEEAGIVRRWAAERGHSRAADTSNAGHENLKLAARGQGGCPFAAALKTRKASSDSTSIFAVGESSHASSSPRLQPSILFEHLINIERHRPAHAYALNIVRTCLQRADETLKTCQGMFTADGTEKKSTISSLKACMDTIDRFFGMHVPGAFPRRLANELSAGEIQRLLTALGPTFAAGPWAVMENLTRLGTHESESGSKALLAMMRILGCEPGSGNLTDAWQSTAKMNGVTLPHPSNRGDNGDESSSRTALSGNSYALANIRLALSLFPRTYNAEILGLGLHGLCDSSEESRLWAEMGEADIGNGAAKAVRQIRRDAHADVLSAAEALLVSADEECLGGSNGASRAESVRAFTADAENPKSKILRGYIAGWMAERLVWEEAVATVG